MADSNILRKLAGKYTKGKASRKEQELLESYYAYKQTHGEAQPDIDPEMQSRMYDRIIQRIDRAQPEKQSLKYWIGIAAALLLITGSIAFLRYKSNPLSSKGLISVMTKKGERRKLVLPDSSVVMLNSDSRLTYPQKFNGQQREVSLTGEAFFEVTHHAKRPFIVHSAQFNIKVLGTQFNVSAYANEQQEAYLFKGSIQVLQPSSNQLLATLQPREKFIAGKGLSSRPKAREPQRLPDTKLIPKEIMPEKEPEITEIAWTQNRLAFENKDFAGMARLLERWYDVKINITNPALLKYRFTGTFNNLPLDDVLNALTLTTNFNYRKEDKTINIY
ncbi:FecR family protein [Pedobacter sp. AW31-3R]|uniref:FecR family protein n=1 Tax=Pedobacter sp. AW31-3R TaxID=3445781 RepID=UPI003FA05D47